MNLRRTDFFALSAALVLLFVVRGIAQTEPEAASAAPSAEMAPLHFDVPNVAGDRIRSEDLRGQVVLLDLWATWCGPCEEALPFYAALHERYADAGLVVVAISVDDELETVQRFLRPLSLPFAVGWDEGQLLVNQLQPTTMPTSYLIGRDGSTLDIHVGFRDADREGIEARVVAALGDLPAARSTTSGQPVTADQPASRPSVP